MENFLSEHGEIILYGLIGIMVVVITCGLCKNKWNQITPEYKNEKSQSNEKFLKESKDKYPVVFRLERDVKPVLSAKVKEHEELFK